VYIKKLIIAGWTGRDRDATEKHIRELEELGVPRPATLPTYYQVAAARATTSPAIEVNGRDSTGEVEFVLLQKDGELWVGVGSDHTDRKVETIGVTISKQLCDKPICPQFWRFQDVANHWDRLMLRSYIYEDGEPCLYQEGAVTTMRDPVELIAGYCGDDASLADGTAMFCGTLAAKGGVRFSEKFEIELEDPVLNQSLRHSYRIEVMPVAG